MKFRLPPAARNRLRRSVQQEKAIARDVGGRRVAGSGNQPGNKGDVTAPGWRIEAKQTVAQRFTITLKMWRQIYNQAVAASSEPALVIEMAGRKLAVLDYETWLSLRG